MKLILCISVCFLNVIDAYYVDVRVASFSSLLGRQLQRCTLTNTFCGKGCKNLARCINGVEQNIQTCGAANPYCNDDNGIAACGPRMGFKCALADPTTTFKCASLGFFPDPVSCRKYHFCCKNPETTTSTTTADPSTSSTEPPAPTLYDPSVGFTVSDFECINNSTYNAATATCDGISRQCPAGFPVPLCTSPGQMNRVNGPIYSLCLQYSTVKELLYPFLFKCSTNVFPCLD